jgi:CheY-like chemotaxis protein
VRDTARAILKRYGYRLACVRNGREALALLARHAHRFGLVLLDLTMPEMDGAEAAPIIRKRWPHLRVLLSSGYNEEEARRLAGTDCVDGFVKKPYRAATLAEQVQRLLAPVAHESKGLRS